MNIYDFIHSKDVRKYLQEIQYQFTTAEAAFVVYWCKYVTLSQKIEAWQEIIETMPDCSMKSRINMMQIDSFHAFLKDYIALQKRDIQDFYACEGYIYRYELLDKDGWNGDERFDFFFSDYASCVANCRKVEPNLFDFLIFKCPYNQTERMLQIQTDTILLNNNFEIMDVNVSHKEEHDNNLESAFEGMCFDFPTPFRCGDILAGYAMYERNMNEPFVLSYISTWDSKEMLSRGFGKHKCPFQEGWEKYDRFVRKLLDEYDALDMCAYGIDIRGEEGTLFPECMLIIPIDLEYYREPLVGVERQLQVLSCYEKGEIDASLLTNCCSAIRMEEYSEKINRQCTRLYTKEAMELCGMLSADK